MFDVNSRYVEQFGPIVRSGPFAGLRYPLTALANRHVAPRLIGSYERCLHGVIAGISNVTYERIADIGCAEGYYAVSLSLQHREATVYAFDADGRELALCRQMAELNGATNVECHSFCDAHALARLIRNRRCLVVSDCEGFEASLFSREVIEAARTTDALIELHEDQSPGVTQQLTRQFHPTHAIQLIRHDQPRPDAVPGLVDALGLDIAARCLIEFRDEGQQWIWAVAKNGSV